MSNSSRQRSDDFLRIADQFKLGELVTEGFHPVTRNLSAVARDDLPEALRLLFEVDDEVVGKYREVIHTGRLEAIAGEVHDALRRGGRIFFTGCGSTGRLSILLDSIWRDFWQQRRGTQPPHGASATNWEDRTVSVMAGGDFALIKAVEGFEDYTQFGRKQIRDLGVAEKDVVFAITEGGETSFVIGTAWEGVDAGAQVYFVYNNPDEILCRFVERSREVIEDERIQKLNLATGPMAISGSTRMQATTIQLCVLITVLEMVLRRLSGEASEHANTVPQDFLKGLEVLQQTLKSDQILHGLASLVQAESTCYQSGAKATYHADHFAIDVLTDTTERSPTFCTPPFRKHGDRQSSESMVFLFVPGRNTPDTWRWLLKRPPRCLDWCGDDVKDLVPPDRLERVTQTLGTITEAELMRFCIGTDGRDDRSVQDNDFILCIAGGDDEVFPDEVRSHPSCRTLVFKSSEAEPAVQVSGMVRVPVPPTGMLLDGLRRVAVKMVLNAMSTSVMVQLGRVMGNTMIYVVPSNLKLIDRATRYIVQLTDTDYPTANRLLFEAVEYVEPRMLAGQTYPPVVGLTLLRSRKEMTFEEAERSLAKGLTAILNGGP